MRIYRVPYYTTPELIRYTGLYLGEPVDEDCNGNWLTDAARVLARAAANGYDGLHYHSGGGGDYDPGYNFRGPDGAIMPATRLRKVQLALYRNLWTLARSHALRALELPQEPPGVSRQVRVALSRWDLVCLPLVDYDKWAHGGERVEPTYQAVSLALLWAAKDLGPFDTEEPDATLDLTVRREVWPVFQALKRRWNCSGATILRAAIGSYAQAVREGRQPRPDHLEEGHPALAPSAATRILTKALTPKEREARAQAAWEARGALRDLPEREQARYDRERGEMYGIKVNQ